MTRKRYIKLGYALMAKINKKHIDICGKGSDDWGKVLKNVQTIKFNTDHAPKTSSYKEAWESIKTIREQYGM